MTTSLPDSLPSGTLSIVKGSTEQPLWDITLSQLLEQQAQLGPQRQCVVFPSHNYRATYQQLYQSTLALAKGLISAGVLPGDNIGILAGNCPQYIELFFAASHVSAALVVLNNTYTPTELKSALKHSECKLLFTAANIGKFRNSGVLDMLSSKELKQDLKHLQEVIILKPDNAWKFRTYDNLVQCGKHESEDNLFRRTRSVKAGDVCNLQFTSGTTGSPKAAMLTHRNLINNGRFVGDRMRLTPRDIICCPPPLFHCFGLVLGLLAALTHRSSIVFPSETFQPIAVLQAVTNERCTALHGVPAMFSSELSLLQRGMDFSSLRTGIAAGAPVPKQLMEDLRKTLNMVEITNTYGMTETSPASFMTFTDDPIEKRLSTVGRILPHMAAKIVDASGEVVPMGSRGELCVSGFALQKGYWQDPKKTAEVMRTDKDGQLWMHTGDEAMFDAEGYCYITGRIKDIIIRGGENIAPREIEERLVQHPSIAQAAAVGITDAKYGEVVGVFLQPRKSQSRPSTESLQEFVRANLGWHKAPAHIFWLGANEDFPVTGSGKIKKHILKARGDKLIKSRQRTAKL